MKAQEIIIDKVHESSYVKVYFEDVIKRPLTQHEYLIVSKALTKVLIGVLNGEYEKNTNK